MAKLFLFSVGGSGARVLRSLTMLLAAGVKAEKDWEIVPIIIDPQQDNGDVLRAQELLGRYSAVRHDLISDENKNGTGFFAHKIILKDNFYKFNLNLKGKNNGTTVRDYFGLKSDRLQQEHKDFAKLLFSGNRYIRKDESIESNHLLDLDMKIGFEGNPNIGSIVLSQITENKTFWKSFDELVDPVDDRIFIVSSIFGGTGASAFPVILKVLRNENSTEYFSEGKAADIVKMKIASLVVMPYFNISTDKENTVIKSSEFLHKTKVALHYYDNNINPELETIYHIRDDLKVAGTYEYNSGIEIYGEKKKAQQNDSHFIEFAGALSIFDFLDDTPNERNVQKGFAVAKKDKEMSLTDFSAKCCEEIAPKLFSFFAMKKFFENFSKREKNVKQPWNLSYKISKEFLQEESELKKVLDDFEGWAKEMHRNSRSLKLFNFKKENDDDKDMVFKGTKLGDLFADIRNDDSYFKIDENLNKDSIGTKKNFLDLFFESCKKSVGKINGAESAIDYEAENNMPKHIFKDGEEAITLKNFKWGWFKVLHTNKYSGTTIDDIKEPEIVDFTGKTSIPTPFAKMDVLKLALLKSKNENNKKTLSRFLDVAELLFNYDLLKDSIGFSKWEKDDAKWEENHAKEYDGDNPFLKSLKLHLGYDLECQNFKLDKVNEFFLIKYNSEIIGATSPLTLFLATDDSVNPIRLTPNKILFGETCKHLNERDEKFEEWFVSLYKQVLLQNKNRKLELPELKEYLISQGYKDEELTSLNDNSWNKFKETKADYEEKYQNKDKDKNNILESTLKEYIFNLNKKRNTNEKEYKAYKKITVNGKKDSESVKTLDIDIYYEEFKNIKSDFIVGTYIDDNYFIIPNDYDEKLSKAIWIDDVTFGELKNLNVKLEVIDEYIPGTKIKHKNILKSDDFLEEKIIQVPYEINDNFFKGNKYKPAGKEKSVLLPLKKKFFEVFNAADLLPKEGSGRPEDGCKKPEIEIDNNGTSIDFKLFIPIADGKMKICFKKTYQSDNIIKKDFSITLFPFLKYPPEIKFREYFIHAVSDDKEMKILNFDKEKIRKLPQGGSTGSKVFCKDGNFGHIEVQIDGYSNILIPKFKPIEGDNVTKKQFNFAVDFGTSNTNVEFSMSNYEDSKILSFEELSVSLYKEIPDDKVFLKKRMEQEFLPSSFRGFPHATSFIIDHNEQVPKILMNCNGFYVCELNDLDISDKSLKTDLKWSKNEKDIRQEYIREKMMLIRAKVLIDNGDLNNVNLVCFYPSSMEEDFQESIKKAWNNEFENFFDRDDIKFISESIAPYYYYSNTPGILGYNEHSTVLTVDIGGGTSDILVYKNNIPKVLSSFPFAGNALFADFGKTLNAFAEYFVNEYAKIRDLTPPIRNMINWVKERKNSAYTNAFLFSIKEHPFVKELYKNRFADLNNLDYAQKLISIDKVKVIFIYFYYALIYHINKILVFEPNSDWEKEKAVTILFSGNGSKILNIIGKDLLKKIAQEILNKEEVIIITETKTEKGIIDSKRLTCMGGIKFLDPKSNKIDDSKISDISYNLSGFEEDSERTYKEMKKYTQENFKEMKKDAKKTFKEIKEDEYQHICKFVNDFNKYFLGNIKNGDFLYGGNSNRTTSIHKYFERYIEEITDDDLKKYLKHGLKYYSDGLDTENESKPSCSLLFFPIVGIINRYIAKIVKEI